MANDGQNKVDNFEKNTSQIWEIEKLRIKLRKNSKHNKYKWIYEKERIKKQQQKRQCLDLVLIKFITSNLQRFFFSYSFSTQKKKITIIEFDTTELEKWSGKKWRKNIISYTSIVKSTQKYAQTVKKSADRRINYNTKWIEKISARTHTICEIEIWR